MKGDTKTSESLVDAVNKSAQGSTNETRPRAMIKNCTYYGEEHFQGRSYPAYKRQCGKCVVKLNSELDRMTSLGIIEKVEKPTDWVNSIVVVD